MKLPLIKRLLVFSIFICLLGFCFFNQERQILHSIDCGIPFGYDIISAEDTHSGFHGDGKSFYHFSFSNNRTEQRISASPNWKYGIVPDAVQQYVQNEFSLLLEDSEFYWLFYDKNNGLYNTESLSDNTYSSNYIIALYIPSARNLYYMSIDT